MLRSANTSRAVLKGSLGGIRRLRIDMNLRVGIFEQLIEPIIAIHCVCNLRAHIPSELSSEQSVRVHTTLFAGLAEYGYIRSYNICTICSERVQFNYLKCLRLFASYRLLGPFHKGGINDCFMPPYDSVTVINSGVSCHQMKRRPRNSSVNGGTTSAQPAARLALSLLIAATRVINSLITAFVSGVYHERA